MTRPPPADPSSSDEWLSVTPEPLGPSVALPAVRPRAALSDQARARLMPPNDPLIGSTLQGTYVIEYVLGEGGMGRIYHAHHARIESKQFAIKVLRDEVVSNPQVRARFRREAQAVARIEHPGVVTIIDTGTTSFGAPYLVCERLEGMDLRDYSLRFGKMSSDDVIGIGKQMCAALVATHERGVIHRDLKPSNVFLLGPLHGLDTPLVPRVKILDFGLSSLVHAQDQLSHTGLVMGTPGYMSPEQAQGQRCDPRTDVYGVGAVLYAAATLSAPFREDTAQKTLMAMLTREPPPPRTLNPRLSRALERVLLQALSRDPDDRQQSMAELGAALHALDTSKSEPPPELDAVPKSRSSAGLRKVRLGAVALCLATVALVQAGAVASAMGLLPRQGARWWSDLGSVRGEVAVVAGSMFACGFLFVLCRQLARYWHGRAWLSAWTVRTRSALVAAAAAYGGAAFAIELVEAVSGASPRLGLPHISAAWKGWHAVLFLLALVAAAAEANPARLSTPPRRALIGALGLALVLGTVWVRKQPLAPYHAEAQGSLAVARAPLSTSTPFAEPEEPPPSPPAGSTATVGSSVAAVQPVAFPGAGAKPAPTRPAPPGGEEDEDSALAAAHFGDDEEQGERDDLLADAAAPLDPSGMGASGWDASAAMPELLSAAASGAPDAAAPEALSIATVFEPPRPLAPASRDGNALGLPSTPAPPRPAAKKRWRASTGELRAAVARGPDALTELSGRYPSDPDVLHALLLSHASRKGELPAAVEAIGRLSRAAPARRTHPDVRQVLARAVRRGGPESRAALGVMSSQMGSDGPDLLYDMLGRKDLARRAAEALSSREARAHFTPQLSIAYDLRFADSCQQRLPLLDRAIREGDMRSLRELSRLVRRPRGCRRGSRSRACRSRCHSHETPLRQAMAELSKRLRTQGLEGPAKPAPSSRPGLARR